MTLQQSLRNLNQAFTNFFEGRAEYPSFKSKKGDQTARHVGTAFDIREENGKRKLRLSKMPGRINIRWSRELPSQPSSCRVTKNAAGQYHVCFVCTEDARLLPRVNGEGGDLKFVGIDLGIESLITLSTGERSSLRTNGSRPASGARSMGTPTARNRSCSECGAHHDRDITAAKNLSRVGQPRIHAPGQLDKTDVFEAVGTAG